MSTSRRKMFFWLITILLFVTRCSLAARFDPCETGSCLPGTGNLLIGRENRLTASSTCGLRGPERFCVITSLEKHKNCFKCDSSNTSKNLNHRIENIVSKAHASPKKVTWWQSENGVENVSIQLNLEAEFYFTHLYIKFKTFRPSGALVERSLDYGQTWKVYGYFAYDCSKLFPGVPKESQTNLSVPYCNERYSSVTPISNGELILKILPPTLDNVDPYSEEIQNLVKITNLRVNFTKLHTLGDDLLDNRTDIKEKYYYAIYEMIVGGSCACYGHANRCVPQEGVESRPNMVNGKCECTHYTKGLNCEKCEDLYNDLEWKPAIGRQTNACKKCNCNNHATSCHFDSSVFESTGRQSGGICDNCLHNTMGRNCEQCKHFFYQDPARDFSDPYVCVPCDCDPHGSLDDGICDSRTDPANDLVSGRCHCKVNVEGRRCDTCKNGFWNFSAQNPEGCQSCSCNILGTYGNQGCNKDTGECTCKRNVVGRDCNKCLPEYWGLGDTSEGCQPCNCNPGGSFDNQCDVVTGQCKCRPNITGRNCNMVEQTYFLPSIDYSITEAEVARCHGICSLELRPSYPNTWENSWTGPGFMRVGNNSSLEFDLHPVNVDGDFNVVIRYEPTLPFQYSTARIILQRPFEVSKNSNCSRKTINNDVRDVALSGDSIQVIVNPPFCLEANQKYVLRVEFSRFGGNQNVPTASILIDSVVLTPHIDSLPFMTAEQLQEYRRNRCDDYIYAINRVNLSDVCRTYHFSIGAYVYGGGQPCECDSTGSYSSICSEIGGKCNCKPNVQGRKCDSCAPSTYGFGPEGCKACDCHNSGALDNFCDIITGQCRCRPQTYGRGCDQCQPGSWNYPNCQRCVCHGHADICNQQNGACIGCKNFTDGNYCDRCIDGYYGDPRIGSDIPCRMCPCPGTVDSGHSYASRCALDPRTQDVICECQLGYSGSRCERCSENYFGHPEVSGGKCEPCNCSNNVDPYRAGNCDPTTGQCNQCLYNTEGFHCEYCKSGFYGDALQQQCRECICDILGTDPKRGPCDKFTGQCPCLPNVTGLRCDGCEKNHWKIASGIGCEACNCDPIGSESEQCNQYDGQCSCKAGFGGRRCNQCQANYWGDPNKECYPCQCNPEGSAGLQCDQLTGYCRCVPGIGGPKCDQCARGYLGQMPYCSSCGECFDNWDLILIDLKSQTKLIADRAAEIMKTGASGSYIKEFEMMEKQLAHVKQSLQNTTASSLQLQELDKLIADVRSGIMSPDLMTDVRTQAENVTQRITLLNLSLNEVKAKANGLNETSQRLKDNATKLQEGNVEGALNLTREAYNRAQQVKAKNMNTANIVSEADRSCKKTEAVMTKYSTQFTQGLQENDNNLQKLSKYVSSLEMQIPGLNQQVCDKGGDPCNDLCGGAGCDKCGGFSCDEGAVTKAQNALDFAKRTEKVVQEKETKIGELYRGVKQAQTEASNAKTVSDTVSSEVETAKNKSAIALNHTLEKIAELEKFINNSGSTPSSIRQLASETMQKTIKLQPEKINELAQKINETVSSLTNIDAIIRETEGDLNTAKIVKQQAMETKVKAEKILQVTDKVVSALNMTEELQKLAESAIQMANENISFARKDLAEISEKGIEAQRSLNDTVKQFGDLENRFKNLQTDYLKNSAEAQAVETELKGVAEDVEQTQKKTSELITNYQNTVAELDKKAMNSSEAFENSQVLLQKASQLYANATEKVKELRDFESNFESQSSELVSIEAAISELKKKMENIYEEIKSKSEYYQTCL